MKTIDLSEENIGQYSKWIDTDMAENMSRMYFRGIACTDDDEENVTAAMIWELQSVEKNENTESRLCWMYSEHPEDMGETGDGSVSPRIRGNL